MPSDTASSVSHSRRHFLKLAAATAAGLAAKTPLAIAADTAAKKVPIGIELYGVREALKADLFGTVKAVAKMGYEAVEFYSAYAKWEIAYAKEVRALLDDLGVRCLSTHNSIESFTPGDGMAKAIEINKILGTRQMILASAPGKTKTVDTWKALCEQMTTAVTQLAPLGLSAGFHNHHMEWLPVAEGAPRAMDIIAANTPKEFILQLDVGTCVEAGVDPVAWVKANPGRIRSMHLKDWAPGDKAEEKGYRVLFGEGVAPWKELIAAAESVGGIEVFLIEQEGSRFSELETAERCLASWKKLRAS